VNSHILVIDDDAGVRLTLQHVLTAAKFQVTCAANGAEGMLLFLDLQPQLVICDLIMPEQEGIETILQIKRESPQTKVIAISGGGRIGSTNMLELAQRVGADFAVSKPFSIPDLLLAVRAAMPELTKTAS
jgi:CheY-like chemotaxis protein